MLSGYHTAARSNCAGAAMVEFQIVALFALLPLCLGMLQAAFLLAENHHIDHAAFLAARHAAMAHGEVAAARRAFSQAASVLFVSSGEPVDAANVPQRAAAAIAAAAADQALFARINILSPDAAAQHDFAIQRAGARVIPNDSLEYRSRMPGRRSGLTLQQANLLRLEVEWCRPLIVPFAREMLLGALRLFDREPWRQSCYAAGRVPIRSEGTSPMQSDFKVSS
ncbi:MAG: hypothetical protein ABW278_14270 [Steroidobacteraceae bacterium]